MNMMHTTRFLSRTILIGVFAGTALLPMQVMADSDSEKTYRFAEKPWGLDTPAGRCVVCHSLEKNGEFRVAPNLWGIVGAPKARASDHYSYSQALLKKGGVWTEDQIDKFLADADEFLPGTTKSIKVRDAEERQRIIDFLKTLKD